jgi:signal transduction histidine kinase
MQNKNFINKITNTSLISVAIIGIPLNLIIYFALIESENQIIRIIPPLFSIFAVFLALFRNKISFFSKSWAFILLLFFTGCFNLLLGLLDLGSLWFILAIIFTLLIAKKNEALALFIISFCCITITGILMMTKTTFIPLKYNFENCHFSCVAVRIVHFLLIGFSVYYILYNFFSQIKSNVIELENKSLILENLNISLIKEMTEKKEIQQKMLETVILTEEKERKRLAGDLHDGLGPVLSAVNLYFQAYLDAPEIQKPEIEIRLKQKIENAIADVSRISHNISPHILEKFGLITALDNFINQIRLTEKIKFSTNFQKINRFDLKAELTIYRTITELINNTLKHAFASEISIKIYLSVNFINVDYTDNGKGFDIKQIDENQKGIGLNNMKNRVNSLNGKISINSSKNTGITVEISLPYVEN